jgi:para-nitrobenzyl esterase
MILVIDNYDSFTCNLAQYPGELKKSFRKPAKAMTRTTLKEPACKSPPPALNLARVAAIGFALVWNTTVAPAAGISGVWHAEFDTQIGPQKYTFTFQQDGGKITGKAKADVGGEKHESDVQDGRLADDRLTFHETFEFQGNEVGVDYTGKVAGDEIQFTRKVGDFATEELVAKRVKDESPAASVTSTTATDARRVTIQTGTLEGASNSGIRSFKGIPFAKPPVGDLRWKAPQPPESWAGARKADAFAAAPMQGAGAMGGSARMSEDCLYLNVWTPARTAGEKRPVMVWIYGGAFMAGMTSTPQYDGTKLAQKGVVVVSIAYRVGAFGFLAHPELSRESGTGSGGYGIQDQVAGLRWVRDNIAQFGGDPAKVTIFGESAGGISVSMLTVVPAAKGLFQRAISESGGSFAPVKFDEEAGENVPSLKRAEETGKRFLESLGAKDLKAARALGAEEIQRAVRFGQFWPVADGATLPGDQYNLYEAGQFNDTPVLIGSNSDEGAMFVRRGASPADFEQRIRDGYGPAAQAILKAYRHSTEAEAFKSSKDIFRETAFAWPTWTWARLQSRKGRHKAFVYYFDHHAASAPDGASHAAEIGYVFGNLGAWGKPGPEAAALSELMSAYWVNFATTGDPNGPGLPAWPAFTKSNMKAMVFDGKPGSQPLPNLEKLEAVDKYYTWRREQERKKLRP